MRQQVYEDALKEIWRILHSRDSDFNQLGRIWNEVEDALPPDRRPPVVNKGL